MEIPALAMRALRLIPPPLLAAAERALRALPFVRRRLRQQIRGVLRDVAPAVKPYRGRIPAFTRLPEAGVPRDEVLRLLEAMAAEEAPRWRNGFASGAVYHGAEDHVAFLNQVYALESQSNPLHSDLWPSVGKLEAEVVAMTAAMLGAEPAADPEREICGTVTSGGTESILLAMKAYRDRARAERGVDRPEIAAPETAHPAFDKAAQLLGMRIVRVPVGRDRVADVAAMRRAVGRRTAVVVGSAPAFPYGLIDPVGELSEVAQRRGAGFHVDACLGGFVLPFARRLGYAVPEFDFRLPGVTSISADTHKFGYAAKGSSVVLYRGRRLRALQYFTSTDWPGGLYFSPTLAGSRPGALPATAWAAMLAMGQRGYLEAARAILETAARIKEGIRAIPDLEVIGDPLFVVAFRSPTLDVYRVLDAAARRGWSLNGLQRPPAVHLCVTLRHAQPGVAERFLADLRDAIDEVRAGRAPEGGMAPVYGLAASLPVRGVVADMLAAYLDLLYEVD